MRLKTCTGRGKRKGPRMSGELYISSVLGHRNRHPSTNSSPISSLQLSEESKIPANTMLTKKAGASKYQMHKEGTKETQSFHSFGIISLFYTWLVNGFWFTSGARGRSGQLEIVKKGSEKNERERERRLAISLSRDRGAKSSENH